jgi:hypothetical protein
MTVSEDNPPQAVTRPPRPAEVNNNKDYEKAEYGKRLDEWLEARKQTWAIEATELALENTRANTQLALDNTRDDAMVTAETSSLAAIQAAYIATTQTTLDRVLTRANVLTAAVGTIITLYTGLLAFIYTKADTATGGDTGVTERPLQVVGLVPPLFLALALFLVTIYAAVLRNKTTVGPFLPTGIGGQVAEMRLVTYMRWCFAGVLARRWALHAGITSLGVGIATLPLPFIETDGLFQWAVFLIGLAAVAGTAAWTQWGSTRRTNTPSGTGTEDPPVVPPP